MRPHPSAKAGEGWGSAHFRFQSANYPRFLPPGFPLNPDLEKPPGLEPPLNGGLDLPPELGFPLPPKLGLGFQPGLPPGRAPDPESVRGGRGANELSPSSRRNEGLADPPGLAPNDRAGAPVLDRPPGFHPVDEGLSPVRPGLLFGRAPPARGLPLLVVNGRANPPSPRKGRDELGRGGPERSEPGLSELGLSELDRPEPDGRELGGPDLNGRALAWPEPERPPEAGAR